MTAQPAPALRNDADPVLRALLSDVLGLAPERVAGFADETQLFGALPEFDSMAVANLLTGIEERFGVTIEDDEVEAEDFASYGALLSFVERVAKLLPFQGSSLRQQARGESGLPLAGK